MDKCRRLFQFSQAPDFRVGDLLHVQSWQYHSSFMMNNSKAVEFTAHLPRFGGASHPAGLLKARRLPAFLRGVPNTFAFSGRPSNGILKP